ncbi:11703_t:CDS:2, partial [Diversispora eburnea]
MSSSNNIAASSSVAAAAIGVTFYDEAGTQSTLANAAIARISPPDVVEEHPLLKQYKSIAKNAYAGLCKFTKKVADITESKPGFLHSLDFKFEGNMKREDLTALNLHCHNIALPYALEPLSKKVTHFRTKLTMLPEQFADEMKASFWNAASQDDPKKVGSLETFEFSRDQTVLVDNNIKMLTNFITMLKVKATASLVSDSCSNIMTEIIDYHFCIDWPHVDLLVFSDSDEEEEKLYRWRKYGSRHSGSRTICHNKTAIAPKKKTKTIEILPSKVALRQRRRRERKGAKENSIFPEEAQRFKNEGLPNQKRSKKKVFVNNVSSLSDNLIPSYVYSLLNKGANFQLTYPCSIRQAAKSWSTSLQEFYQKAEQGESGGEKINKLKKLENIIYCINFNLFNKIPLFNRKYQNVFKFNLNCERVFRWTIANKVYVVLADKNLGLTLVNQDWYKQQMSKFMNDKTRFEFVPGGNNIKPWIKYQFDRLKTIIHDANKDRVNCTPLFADVWDENALSIPQIYGLVKVHKSPMGMRFISPVHNWINTKAAKWVAAKLQPFVDECNSYVLENSLALLNFQHDYFPRNAQMQTADITDMYNNIGQRDAISIISAYLKVIKSSFSFDANDINFIMSLIQWVFNSSYVFYDKKYYLQRKGLPMGSPLSPVVANLFMIAREYVTFNNFEVTLRSYSGMTINYFRYLDDVFIISVPPSHKKDNDEYNKRVDLFYKTPGCTFLNNIEENNSDLTNTNIKFEGGPVISEFDVGINFLDLNIKWVPVKGSKRKTLKFSLYDKPMNKHIYTDPQTFYPPKYIFNWIQGENIRLIRNNDDYKTFLNALQSFKYFLSRRSYPNDRINEKLLLNDYRDRSDLLTGLKPHQERREAIRFRSAIIGTDTMQRKWVITPLDNNSARPLVHSGLSSIVRGYQAITPDSNCQYLFPIRKGRSIYSSLSKALKSPFFGRAWISTPPGIAQKGNSPKADVIYPFLEITCLGSTLTLEILYVDLKSRRPMNGRHISSTAEFPVSEICFSGTGSSGTFRFRENSLPAVSTYLPLFSTTIKLLEEERNFETTTTSPFISNILEPPESTLLYPSSLYFSSSQSSTVPRQVNPDTWTTNLTQQIKGGDYFGSPKLKRTTSDIGTSKQKQKQKEKSIEHSPTISYFDNTDHNSSNSSSDSNN